jgi:hypothetical protein
MVASNFKKNSFFLKDENQLTTLKELGAHQQSICAFNSMVARILLYSSCFLRDENQLTALQA